MATGPQVNVARSLETGTIGAILVVILATTGSLLSPTLSAIFPALMLLQAAASTLLYVTHLASAALLIAFVIWHLLPFGHSFSRKGNVALSSQIFGWSALALVVVQLATGLVLYFHAYGAIPKRTAVLLHLVNAGVVLAPVAAHSVRGARVWWKRRGAQAKAMGAARKAGRGDAMIARQKEMSRRAFLRVTTYATAGIGLALAFGKYTAGQLAAWRLNFVGDTPALDKESYRLRVTGVVGRPVELTYQDLLALPTETVRFTHHCVEGWTYTDDFTGTRVSNVLSRAGGLGAGAAQLILKSPEVSKQRGQNGRQYTTNIAADALDDVWLIWKVGGEDLPALHGFPVRLMSPRKWGYKACKWLTEIEVTADASYQGYWERLGYHNAGDYPGPIFA